MRFETLRFDNRSRSFDRRFAAIFGEGFAGEQESIFAGIGRTRGIRAAIAVKVTARAAIFEAAAIGVAATAAIVAAIASAVITAIGTTIWPTIISAVTALRRSVLGRRQIAPAALAEVASTATTTTPAPAKAASATAKLRTVTTGAAVSTTIITAIVSTIRRTAITARAVAR